MFSGAMGVESSPCTMAAETLTDFWALSSSWTSSPSPSMACGEFSVRPPPVFDFVNDGADLLCPPLSVSVLAAFETQHNNESRGAISRTSKTWGWRRVKFSKRLQYIYSGRCSGTLQIYLKKTV